MSNEREQMRDVWCLGAFFAAVAAKNRALRG
jgi:hypothetical protein